MRILYVINTGLIGGLQRHVLCLMQCLCAQGERVKGPSAEVAVAINAVTDPRVVEMFEKEGLKVYLLGGKSGHDLRVVGRFKKVLEDFKPDVIHAHGLPIVVGLWMLLGGKRCPVVHSIHTPSGKPTLKGRVECFVWDHVVDYWLPVSGPTWAMFKRWHPNAKGEVFFNPLRMDRAGAAEGRGGVLLTPAFSGRGADITCNPSTMRRLAEMKVEEWLKDVTRDSFVAALEKLVAEKAAANEYRFRKTGERELALNGAVRFFDEFSRKIVELSDGRCVYFAPDARSRTRNFDDLSRCWAEYAFHAVSNGGIRVPGKKYNERWYNSHKMANFSVIERTLSAEKCFVRLNSDVRYDAVVFDGGVSSGFSFQVVTRLDVCGNIKANLTEVTFTASSKKGKKPPRLVALAEAVQTVVHHQTTPGSYPSDGGSISNTDGGCNRAMGRAAGNTQTTNFIVGMVGRAADQKDWPSFHKVAALVGERLVVSGWWLVAGGEEKVGGVEFLNAGEEKVCNGREAIAKMDLFMMTSKHEQLPTTVLECFALGTPICGFIPDGGTTDILQFSTGPVRDAFIKERSCEKLADIVLDLLAHPEKRAALVADGRQILENHFDAEKLCKGQLMEVYRKVKVKMRGEDGR